MKISAYIPAYNNEDTIEDAINSLKNQSYPINDIFVIDDGSTDQTLNVAQNSGIKVYRNTKNMGRGFTRAKAMELAKYDLVVSCDATNELDINFVKDGITGFLDASVASVYGRISSKSTEGILNKWRSIHLFKENADYGTGFKRTNSLITYGAIVKKSHIMKVGNFNQKLRHSEDEDMGERLLQKNYTLLSNHDLIVNCNLENNLLGLLDRYWRWYIGKDEKMTILDYLHSIKSSFKPMIQDDIQNGHLQCIPISLFCPHYCYFKTLTSKIINR